MASGVKCFMLDAGMRDGRRSEKMTAQLAGPILSTFSSANSPASNKKESNQSSIPFNSLLFIDYCVVVEWLSYVDYVSF